MVQMKWLICLFREGKIEFLQIEELVEKAMNAHELVKDPTI